jgi:Rubisco accumulation factor 1 alpha helical domain/Rubisco Assembly chaperone C-terminal domain
LQTKTFPQEFLSYFDSSGGPELLNELRRLNAVQRADSAKYIIDRRFEPRGAMELSRSIRDFPRRRGDRGWECFSPDSPGDCLAYTQFRLSREAIVDADRIAALEKALEYAETDKAKERIKRELEKGDEAIKADKEQLARELATLKVVRLRYGEVAEASSVTLLPVVTASEGAKGVMAAPGKCKSQGELGVVVADKGWTRWAVMPSWAPLLAAKEAVALELDETYGLPWATMVTSQEKVLVLVDRTRNEVDEDGAYVVEKEGNLVVERGMKLKEAGMQKALAAVVMVVRPPKDEDDMISDDEWD